MVDQAVSIQRIAGKWIVTYTNTFPARRYRYRHDTVEADGVKLGGYIQVRERFGRVEAITCHGNSCVMGAQIDWLIRQQG